MTRNRLTPALGKLERENRYPVNLNQIDCLSDGLRLHVSARFVNRKPRGSA